MLLFASAHAVTFAVVLQLFLEDVLFAAFVMCENNTVCV